MGEWDTNTEVDCDTSEDPTICSPPYVDIEISEIIMHEDYKQRARTQYHDIALLRLKEKVTYSKYITPICLPIHDYAKNKDHVGNSLEVAGWGKTET